LNSAVTNETAAAQQAATAQEAQVAADIANIYGGEAPQTATTTLGTYGGGSTPWANTSNYTINALSPADLQAMGLTAAQGAALQQAMQQAGTTTQSFGTAPGSHNFSSFSPTSEISIGQYLNAINPQTAITAANEATPQQYAEESAINQLLGSQAPLQTEVLNPAMASQAGTAPTNLENFNYNAALQNAQNTASAEQQANVAEANAINGAGDVAHAQGQHGGILQGLEQDITHPLSTLGAAVNPAAWVGNASNLINGQQVSPTAINPSGASVQSVAPAALAAYLLTASPLGAAAGAGAGGAGAATTGEAIAGAAAAKGGEVKEDGTIDSYLDKRTKKHG
jgi:hypothetical protein